jgi:hypothetical protein
MKLVKLISLAAVIALTQGCSTILTEKTSSVNLATSNGKSIDVTIDGQVFKGPGIITLAKSNEDKIIKTETEGCVAETLLQKEIEPVFFINILSGGAFGSSTDYGTKKMWKYKDSVTVNCQ